jgi:hypothetical protein
VTDKNDRKSVSGILITLGGRTLTHWNSQKQKAIAQSSTESEYQGGCNCANGMVFQHGLVTELIGVEAPLPMVMYCDNTGANFLAENNQVSERTKHIDIRHRILGDLVERGKLEVRYIKTTENPADILSKNTKEETHIKLAVSLYNGFVGTPLEEDVVRETHLGLVDATSGNDLAKSPGTDGLGAPAGWTAGVWTVVESKTKVSKKKSSGSK